MREPDCSFLDKFSSSHHCRFLENLFLQDGWTNERHNSYLDYLENSFVTQLYSLLGGGETKRLSRTRDVQSNSHKSTHQVWTFLLCLL